MLKFGLPCGFVERWNRADDDFPARDGKPGTRQASDSADENLHEYHCNADDEPRADEFFVLGGRGFAF